nr:hypothetical protein [Tanacetum cinerariifolium]
MSSRFAANENKKIDKYISGLPDNVYGNVKSSKPRTLDETIELTNDLMDQTLRTYAEKADNKRKTDDMSKNNHGHQQQPFKKQNVTKVYNMGTRERKPYEGSLPQVHKVPMSSQWPVYSEVSQVQQADDEWIKKFIKNMNSNIRALKTITKNMQEKVDQLTQMVLTNTSERVKAKMKMGKNDTKELGPCDVSIEHPYVQPTPFPGRLKGDMDDGLGTTIKDIERLRKILIPTIHTLSNLEPVVQPYMPRGPVRDDVKVVKE